MKGNTLVLAVATVALGSLVLSGCTKDIELARQTDTAPVTAIPAAPGPEGTAVEPPTNEKTAKIVFESAIYDFGQVDAKGTNTCEFKFTNAGDAPLKLIEVQTCCGFKGWFKENNKEYAPGESGAVVVQFDSDRFRGALTEHQHVFSNDPATPRVQLTVKADVIVKVRCEPQELVLALRGDNAGCPEISLVSVDDKPFAVTGFSSTGNCISASFDWAKKAARVVLQPRVDMDKLRSSLNGHIRIGLTHPECDSVLIPFNALPEFQLSPGSIIIRDAEPRKPVKRDAWLLNNYGSGFEIESAYSRKGFIKVLSQEKFGSRFKFELEITPPPPDGKAIVFTDVFTVSIKDGGQMSVDCRGFYARKYRTGS